MSDLASSRDHRGCRSVENALKWLTYLVEHFLRPGAYAQASGLPYFADFTFDHRLDGVVAGCRRDNKELFLVRVDDNAVIEEVLRPADPWFAGYTPLPYEAELDRRESPRSKERRMRRIG